jgi:hypothetical protein
VLEAGGRRFAIDLGPDDYALSGYFSPDRRPGYYRISTAGHNTLLVDEANQPATARAQLMDLRSGPTFAYAVTDLGSAYPALRTVRRGAALIDRSVAAIADEIEGAVGRGIRRQMHTPSLSEKATVSRIAGGGQVFASCMAAQSVELHKSCGTCARAASGRYVRHACRLMNSSWFARNWKSANSSRRCRRWTEADNDRAGVRQVGMHASRTVLSDLSLASEDALYIRGCAIGFAKRAY